MADEKKVAELLKSMTDEQLAVFAKVAGAGKTTAAAGTAAPGGDRLSETQMKDLEKEAQAFKDAQKNMADALGVLWNARLDMAVKTGNAADLRSMIGAQSDFYDNCSCGGGGGGTSNW